MLRTMHILCSIDKNYIMPAGVMMKSISVNNADEDIFFHVIVDDSVSWWQKRQLQNVVRNNNRHKVLFYIFSDTMLDTFPKIGEVKADYLTKTAYYRLFATKILPDAVDKVIYLDGDIVVDKSLKELWDLDMADYAIATVTDMSEKLHDYSRLGYDSNYGYFNSGVLVINLKYWREQNVIDDFMDIIINHSERIKLHDQDILNIVFCKKKICLPLEYNLQNGFMYRPELMEMDYDKYKAAIDYAIKNYVVIHYACSLKPWYVDCDNPLHAVWLKYLKMTRWRNRRLKRMYPLPLRVRIGNVLRKYHLMHPLPPSAVESRQYISVPAVK